MGTVHKQTAAPGVERAPAWGAGGSQIRGWRYDGVVFETHRGVPHAIPKHAHDTYQIGITTRDPGVYESDGRLWHARPGSIIMFNPGQVHSSPQPSRRLQTATSYLMFVDADWMAEIADMVSGGQRSAGPEFLNLVVDDPVCIAGIMHAHRLSSKREIGLELESSLMATLGHLIREYGERSSQSLPDKAVAMRLRPVLDYLEAHYERNISLAELAGVAGTSPYHINRVFAQGMGMPPHAFQTQLRIERAKTLLLGGCSIAQAALETGFCDQSHFTRHFRRIVGVPPRSYIGRQ